MIIQKLPAKPYVSTRPLPGTVLGARMCDVSLVPHRNPIGLAVLYPFYRRKH